MKDFMDLEDDIKMTDKEFCFKMQTALREQDEILYRVREHANKIKDNVLQRILGDVV